MPGTIKSDLPDIDIDTFTIGNNIANIRKKMGFTQKDVAAKIGITRVLLSDYERGKVRIYADMVARIAFTLNVSADEIFGLKTGRNDKENMTAPSLRFMKRIRQIEKLPEHKIKDILRTIDILITAANIK